MDKQKSSPINWQRYIVVDPAICHGQATVKGSRVIVSVVLDNFAVGLNIDEILRSYPSLTYEAVQATVAYVASLTREKVLALPA